jgi:hypothetical protein
MALIALGEVEDEREAGSALRRSSVAGGKKHAENLAPERRAEIARNIAANPSFK